MIRRAWARWRVAARIARRDARRARGRTALVAALVGLPVLVGTAGSVLIASANPTDATYVRWVLGDHGAQARVDTPFGADVDQDAVGRSGGGSSPPKGVPLEDFEAQLRGVLPAADELARTVTGQARLETAGRRLPSRIEVTALPEQDLSGVFPTVEGSLPAGTAGLAISRRWAEMLDVGIGDRVTLDTGDGPVRAVTVTGILARSASGPEAVTGPGGITPPTIVNEDLFTRSESWVQWYVLGPAPVTWDDVRAINRIGSTVTSRAVLADPPPPSETNQNVSSVDSSTVAIAVAVALLALVEAVLIIGPAFAVSAKRSQRQLALLAAAGADRATMRRTLVLAGVLIAAAASAAAVPAGLGVAVAVRQAVHWAGSPFSLPDLRIEWLWPGAFAAVGVLTAGLAASFPARQAARVDVVAALGGRRAEARPRRRVPILGVVLVLAGVAGVLGGAAAGRQEVLVGSLLVLELGVVAASGALVSIAARLAPHLGVAGRLALRDAARHRSRTAPAVAAVLAALAGVTAGAVYQASSRAVDARSYIPVAAVGTVTVSFDGLPSSADVDTLVADGEQVLRDTLPVADVQVVRVAVPSEPVDGFVQVDALPDPARLCPLWSMTRAPTAEEEAAAAQDPRCSGGPGEAGPVFWSDPVTGSTTMVDDGSVVTALGFDASPAAARALAAGRVVVPSPSLVWPDGTAHVKVSHVTGTTARADASAQLPATAVDLPNMPGGLILPPSALTPLGLTAKPLGLVAATTREPAGAEEAAASAAMNDRLRGAATLTVQRGNPFTQTDLVLLVLVGAAALAAVGTTGIAVALAAAGSVPDLATLAAVGAPPRIRRRFAAGQAGVIAMLGGWLGVATGLMLAWGLVAMERTAYGHPIWDLVVPWPTILAIVAVVPLSAMALGWLTTRSRLPVVRRLAS